MKWFSEKNPPMGGPRGLALIGLLNAQRLDDVSILVRETIQNSWDARLSDDEPALVQFSSWSLSERQATEVRDLFSEGLPTTDAVKPLRASLDRKSKAILMVRDVNCHGLEGATLPNERIEGAKNRYISFLLNFGDSKHSDGDGGSYGFGRSITYRMSRSRFILVYTRAKNLTGELESRLIGSLLTTDFAGHTGRHWWGVARSDTCQPLVGKRADDIARKLGAPIYGEDESGTTVLIFDPVIDDLGSLMKFIADSIVWNMWPKMIPRLDGSTPMRFEVFHEGNQMEIKDPMVTHPIAEFCKAFQLLRRTGRKGAQKDKRDQIGQIVHSVDARRPTMNIGLLALRQFGLAAHPTTWATLSDARTNDEIEVAPFGEAPHHVALMRTPELVVTYMPGPPSPDDRTAWCGVFRPFDENDRFFRSAEPPTHDSWSRLRVEDSDGRTAVGVSLTRIRSFTEDLVRSIGPQAPKGDMAVQALARELSKAFDADPERVPIGRGGVGPRTDSVSLSLGSRRLSMRPGGSRQMTCQVSVADRGYSDTSLMMSFVVGVVEAGVSGPVPDSDAVHLISVENRSSVSIWRSGEERVSQIDIEVDPKAFPLRLVIGHEESFAVAVDVKGRRT